MFTKVVVILGALVALFLGVLFAVNLKDEPLSPEVKAVLAASDLPQPGQENGFVLMAGFFAPPQASPWEWGRTQIELLSARDKGVKEVPEAGADAKAAYAVVRWRNLAPCDVKEAGCFEPQTGRTSTAAIRSWLAANPVLVQRCGAMLAAGSWVETYLAMDVFSPFMDYGPVVLCEQVEFARAALEARAGRAGDALRRALRLVAFHRRALAGSASMIGKLIESSELAQAAVFVSDLLRGEPGLLDREQDRRLVAEALRPLSEPERTLRLAIRNEFRISARYVADLATQAYAAGSPAYDVGVPGWMLSTVLLRPNATLTRTWRHDEAAIALDAAQGPGLEEKIRRGAAALEAERRAGVDWIYNPTGKQVAAMFWSRYDEYTGRMRESEALLRLVALQAAVSKLGESEARAAAADAAFSHPFTGRPFDFDAAKRTLSYPLPEDAYERDTLTKVLGPRYVEDGRVTIRLPR